MLLVSGILNKTIGTADELTFGATQPLAQPRLVAGRQGNF